MWSNDYTEANGAGSIDRDAWGESLRFMPLTSRLVRAMAACQMTSVESVGASSVRCLVMVTNSESRIFTEMVVHLMPAVRSRLPTPSESASSVRFITSQSSVFTSKVCSWLTDLAAMPLPSGAFLIRDDFKSSQDPVEAALETLREVPARRRIAVLGELAEATGNDNYREMGARAAAVADRAIFVGNGKNVKLFRTGAVAAGMAFGSAWP